LPLSSPPSFRPIFGSRSCVGVFARADFSLFFPCHQAARCCPENCPVLLRILDFFFFSARACSPFFFPRRAAFSQGNSTVVIIAPLLFLPSSRSVSCIQLWKFVSLNDDPFISKALCTCQGRSLTLFPSFGGLTVFSWSGEIRDRSISFFSSFVEVFVLHGLLEVFPYTLFFFFVGAFVESSPVDDISHEIWLTAPSFFSKALSPALPFFCPSTALRRGEFLLLC